MKETFPHLERSPNTDSEEKAFLEENVEQSAQQTEQQKFQERYERELKPIIEILRPENVPFDEFEEYTLDNLYESVAKIQNAQGRPVEDPEKTFDEIKNLLEERLGSFLIDTKKTLKLNERVEDTIVKRSMAALFLSGAGYPESINDDWRFDELDYKVADEIRIYLEKEITEGDIEKTKIILKNLHASAIANRVEELSTRYIPKIATGFNYAIDVTEKVILGEMPYPVFCQYKDDFEKSDVFRQYIPSAHYHRMLIERLLRVSRDKLGQEGVDTMVEELSKMDSDWKRNHFLDKVSEEDILKASSYIKQYEKEHFYSLDKYSRGILFGVCTTEDFDELLYKKNIDINAIEPGRLPLYKDDIRDYFRKLWKENIESLTFGDHGFDFYEVSKAYACLTSDDYKNLFSGTTRIQTDLIPIDILKDLLGPVDVDEKVKKNIYNALKLSLTNGLKGEYGFISFVNEKLITSNLFPQEILELPEIKEKAFNTLQSAFKNGNIEICAEILQLLHLKKEDVESREFLSAAIDGLKKNAKKFKENKAEKYFNLIKKIAEHIQIPRYFIDSEKIVASIESSLDENTNLIKDEFIQKVLLSETPELTYKNILALANELSENKSAQSDKGLLLAYIAEFEEGGTSEEKRDFLENVQKNISTVAKNESVNFSHKEDYYTYILKQVYPERNYNTYKNLSEYTDRTKDLDKYKFDRNGYELKLSGVLGYKMKEGATSDEKIIDEFSKRIDFIKDIATNEKLVRYLDERIVESKATTVEGKLLEYFKQNSYPKDTVDVLLAYQLRGQYDDFVAGSVDRVSQEENVDSKNYILLDELVNRYGDNMKETIKQVQEAVVQGPDKELFVHSTIDKNQKVYKEILESLLIHFNKIPKDKIRDDTIQKKVLKTVKNTFQNNKEIQDRAEYFASLFSVNDLENFDEVWDKHINELFVVDAGYTINMGKVEALQANVYQTLQAEIGKYEEIKEVDEAKKGEVKLSKERLIKGYFSKNKENAHARMVGDVCLAEDPNMLKNEKYFEFVLFDEEREKCMGTCMLMEMDEKDGKKYLLYCPNPSVGLVSEVSAKKLYKGITDKVIQFSKDNNFDGVLVDKTHGKSTNRAGLFQQSLDQSCLKDNSGKEIAINLNDKYVLGGGYTYQDNLQAVWLK